MQIMNSGKHGIPQMNKKCIRDIEVLFFYFVPCQRDLFTCSVVILSAVSIIETYFFSFFLMWLIEH